VKRQLVPQSKNLQNKTRKEVTKDLKRKHGKFVSNIETFADDMKDVSPADMYRATIQALANTEKVTVVESGES
jgi:hypothetical protein